MDGSPAPAGRGGSGDKVGAGIGEKGQQGGIGRKVEGVRKVLKSGMFGCECFVASGLLCWSLRHVLVICISGRVWYRSSCKARLKK